MNEVSSLVLSFLYLIALPFMGFLVVQQYENISLPNGSKIAGLLGMQPTEPVSISTKKESFEWVDPLASFISDAFQSSDVYEHRAWIAAKSYSSSLAVYLATKTDQWRAISANFYSTDLERHLGPYVDSLKSLYSGLWIIYTERYDEIKCAGAIIGCIAVLILTRRLLFRLLRTFARDVHNIEKGVNEMHQSPKSMDDDDDDQSDFGAGGDYGTGRSILTDFPTESQFPTQRTANFRSSSTSVSELLSDEDDASFHGSTHSSVSSQAHDFKTQYDTASSLLVSQTPSSLGTAPRVSSSASSLRLLTGQHYPFLPVFSDSPSKSSTTTVISEERVVFKSAGTVGSLSTVCWDEKHDSQARSPSLISVD
ncbi:unnamed protein product [Kuraishia capsulata CBS 1993]|uniref:Uncharacterized protein n=1 Tax=Kuraishia capsulata CBS 1993 TaxID=1382522 RepID=W6MNM4_9ASCO|nr:uncharacterized protein KUCA_T00003858001 [Kuraishia capsulata CBS 1993]CDK27878.1 unnamed protein product [Kuraishia capsulata CBS 1993]